MKTKKIVAAIVGSALVATTAFAFAGCGGDSEKVAYLSIADYAQDYRGHELHNCTDLTSLISFDSEKLVSEYYHNGSYCVLREEYKGDYVYNVYNAAYEKYIVQNAEAQPELNFLGSYGYVTKVREGSSYTYYAPDGTELISGITSYSFSYQFKELYVGNDNEVSNVLVVSGEKVASTGGSTRNSLSDTEDNAVINYFVIKLNEDMYNYSFTEVKAENLKFISPEYSAGNIVNGNRYKLYNNADKPVEGEIAEYEVSYIGNTLTFYLNDQKTGSVDLTDADVTTFVGEYLYYSVSIPVDSSLTKGYNLLDNNSYSQMKYNYRLYKYDILNNSLSVVNCDTVITDIYPLYNYTEKSYSAAIISGYEMTDGVACVSYNKTVRMTDSELVTAYDITDLTDYTRVEIYRLTEDKYSVGNYIVDADLNVISRGSPDMYTILGLTSFYTNGYYGWKDFSGKIVIEPRYTPYSDNAIYFYGGYALVNELQNDGSTEIVLLSTDGTTKKVNLSDEETISAESDGFFVVRTGNPTNRTYDYTVYNYAGTVLRKFTGLDFYAVGVRGSYIRVVEPSDDGGSTDTLYKVK